MSLIATGLITQLLKHIVGRPRPNYSLEKDFFGFEFFSFESSLHSFPSGHTSTIFVVAFALSMLTPKIKIYYIFFALIVGLSRVIVGAHFFSDVIPNLLINFFPRNLDDGLPTDFDKILPVQYSHNA